MIACSQSRQTVQVAWCRSSKKLSMVTTTKLANECNEVASTSTQGKPKVAIHLHSGRASVLANIQSCQAMRAGESSSELAAGRKSALNRRPRCCSDGCLRNWIGMWQCDAASRKLECTLATAVIVRPNTLAARPSTPPAHATRCGHMVAIRT